MFCFAIFNHFIMDGHPIFVIVVNSVSKCYVLSDYHHVNWITLLSLEPRSTWSQHKPNEHSCMATVVWSSYYMNYVITSILNIPARWMPGHYNTKMSKTSTEHLHFLDRRLFLLWNAMLSLVSLPLSVPDNNYQRQQSAF